MIRFKSYNAHGRGNLIKQDGIERFLRRAFKEPNLRAILVMLDAEEDCAKEVAEDIARRIRQLSPRVPVGIVAANRCYEVWLLGGLCLSSTPETIAPGKAKLMLSEEVRRKGMGSGYAETSHQARLTAQMKFGVAYRRCRSFRRFINAIRQLLKAIDEQQPIVTP
jgi:hypothetical protein